MQTTLQGTNLDLTDDLRDFVDAKMEDCYRAFGNANLDPVMIDIELERTTRWGGKEQRKQDTQQMYRAEANVSVPGRLLRAEETAPDLKQAIVAMKNTLTREIRTWRERVADERLKGRRKAKDILSGRRGPER